VIETNYKALPQNEWKLPESINQFKFTEINTDTVYTHLGALLNYSNNDILGFDCKLLNISASLIH
jgi:hypothetical protein